MCTFAHAVGKQPKSRREGKNVLFYILFWVAKMNNPILTTQNETPVLHIASK